ncbi:MAG TPA: SpoIIE family protein phosphatase [Euzebyales bacterium]|nr:SpoIIE family protein phosphatase [Euzebyales bacterium]
MGDVTDHGVTAGATIVRLHVAVLADALAGLGPADVVKRVDTLPDQLRTGEIATMVYVVADPGRGRLVVNNAGHPPPIRIEPSDAARSLRSMVIFSVYVRRCRAATEA